MNSTATTSETTISYHLPWSTQVGYDRTPLFLSIETGSDSIFSMRWAYRDWHRRPKFGRKIKDREGIWMVASTNFMLALIPFKALLGDDGFLIRCDLGPLFAWLHVALKGAKSTFFQIPQKSTVLS